MTLNVEMREVIKRLRSWFVPVIFLFAVSCVDSRNDVKNNSIGLDQIKNVLGNEELSHLTNWSLVRKYKTGLAIRHRTDAVDHVFIVVDTSRVNFRFKIYPDNTVYDMENEKMLKNNDASEINELFLNTMIYNNIDVDEIDYNSEDGWLIFKKGRSFVLYACDSTLNIDSLLPSSNYKKVGFHWYETTM